MAQNRTRYDAIYQADMRVQESGRQNDESFDSRLAHCGDRRAGGVLENRGCAESASAQHREHRIVAGKGIGKFRLAHRIADDAEDFPALIPGEERASERCDAMSVLDRLRNEHAAGFPRRSENEKPHPFAVRGRRAASAPPNAVFMWPPIGVSNRYQIERSDQFPPDTLSPSSRRHGLDRVRRWILPVETLELSGERGMLFLQRTRPLEECLGA